MVKAATEHIEAGCIFEDVDSHPAVCLDVASDGSLFAVSLVDGSCRERRGADAIECTKLSIADAIAWKFSGPRSEPDSVTRPWWKGKAGVDPIGSRYATFPSSLAINGHAEFRPGDFYVGSFFHPCICLWIIDDRQSIAGVSLVKGTYPKIEDLAHNYAHRLTPQEAWIWRTKGPQRDWADGTVPLAEMLSTFTDNKSDPARRWWS